jgi:hypothetical protein
VGACDLIWLLQISWRRRAMLDELLSPAGVMMV